MSLRSDSMILLFTIYLHVAYVGESYANVLVRGVARCNTCFPSVTLCIYVFMTDNDKQGAISHHRDR